MTISDLFEETYFSLTINKIRSGLTVLGIVIGIGSVIAMISIGQGASSSIESSIQSIGSNLIQVVPGAQRTVGTRISSGMGSAQTLTIGDAEAISKEISLAKAVAPEVSKRYQVTAKGTNTNVSVVGTVVAYPEVRNLEIDEGLFLTEQNIGSAAKVAVIGPTTRDDLFGEGSSAVGQTVKINKINFKIIGVAKSKGGSGFGSQDDMIFIPITTAQRYLTGGDYVSTVSIEAQDQDSMADLQNQVTDLLLQRHNVSTADFTVMNQADITAAASSVGNTLSTLLGAIAGISLIVGGIGIMNMMLTTVKERTREIGLRKAIGAKRGDITAQFLAESVMLTFIGGIIGIIFGWIAAWAVTQFAGIETSISAISVILAVGVSAAIGIIFGYYPARQAAGLNPIEALRYE